MRRSDDYPGGQSGGQRLLQEAKNAVGATGYPERRQEKKQQQKRRRPAPPAAQKHKQQSHGWWTKFKITTNMFMHEARYNEKTMLRSILNQHSVKNIRTR